MMLGDAGVRQQLLTRPKAEMCFRPWWDTVEDYVLVTMLALGNVCSFRIKGSKHLLLAK